MWASETKWLKMLFGAEKKYFFTKERPRKC